MPATVVNAGGEVVYVGQFYAAMYWGFVFSTSLVGISIVQGYLYFTTSNKDRWRMKALVISLLILDPATSLLMAQTIYHYFVVNFGVVEALGNVPISWIVENGLTVLITAMVQSFLASRVYLVNKTVDALPFGKIAPALVFLFALIAFVMGTARTVFIGVWPISLFSRALFQIFVTVEETCALVSDLLSSACLCYMLAPPHLDAMKRSESLKTMFMFTINRAILMSIVQIGLLCTYLSAKDDLYWVPFHLCKSKLYTNTLLAMLNSRSGGSFQSQTPSHSRWSLPIVNLATEESADTIGHSMSASEGDVEKVAPLKKSAESGSSLANLPSLVRRSDCISTWIATREGSIATTQDD
ncbi:hypothetical protein V8E55_011427 [Tylopilus felleus]